MVIYNGITRDRAFDTITPIYAAIGDSGSIRPLIQMPDEDSTFRR